MPQKKGSQMYAERFERFFGITDLYRIIFLQMSHLPDCVLQTGKRFADVPTMFARYFWNDD